MAGYFFNFFFSYFFVVNDISSLLFRDFSRQGKKWIIMNKIYLFFTSHKLSNQRPITIINLSANTSTYVQYNSNKSY